MSQRCTNCDKYPFCNRIENPGTENDCPNYNKKKLENFKEDRA